jgi:hypothetical protein
VSRKKQAQKKSQAARRRTVRVALLLHALLEPAAKQLAFEPPARRSISRVVGCALLLIFLNPLEHILR